MNLLFADYLLLIYVVVGLTGSALLGCGIGSTGLTWAVRRATRRADAEARAARKQAALAVAALEAATHPITSTDDRPEVDLEALVRVVMDPPAPDPEAWVWDTTPAAAREVSE